MNINYSKLSSGFLQLAQYCNRFNSKASSRYYCVPFLTNGQRIGLLRPDVLVFLKNYSQGNEETLNIVYHEGEIIRVELNCDTNKDSYDLLSSKVLEIVKLMRESKRFITLEGWRDECYDVFSTNYGKKALFKMERSATCIFGFIQHGVNINGYVCNKAGEIQAMWIGKRSDKKQTFPGFFDQMSAGGLASGQSPYEAAKLECKQEASLTDQILYNLKSAGTISYFFEDERGLFPERMFVFDIKLPKDFKPTNADGEMSSFELVPIEQVKQLIIGDKFKFNCALSILDFLFRHSLIKPENESNYSEIMELLHTSLKETILKPQDL